MRRLSAWTSQNCKVNFHVREARIVSLDLMREKVRRIVRLIFRDNCVWACRLTTTRCKIFRRVTFRVRLNHSLVIFAKSCRVLICLDCMIRTLYRNVSYVLYLFPTFYNIVRSPADEHEITPCLRWYHNHRLSQFRASS